jgi:hypothetical protein
MVLIAVALDLFQTRGQTFHSDEWGRLIGYTGGGLETLLRGYSGHLVALHAMLYKGLLEVFGAGSYLPFRIVHALLVGANALLFYMLARARGRSPGCAWGRPWCCCVSAPRSRFWRRRMEPSSCCPSSSGWLPWSASSAFRADRRTSWPVCS